MSPGVGEWSCGANGLTTEQPFAAGFAKRGDSAALTGFGLFEH
jgi:hypothetical protein